MQRLHVCKVSAKDKKSIQALPMSNHNKTLLFVVLLLIGLLILQNTYYPFSNWWYLAIVVPHFILLSYASSNIRLNFFLNAISSAETNKKVVALTFDDGPDPKCTPMVLDILEKYNAKATFFCIGKKIKPSDEVLKRIDKEGHIVGNHSYSHNVIFDFFPRVMMKKDLVKTTNLIEQNIGKKVRFFRPPFGVTTPTMANAVKDLKHTTIAWNNRSLDTIISDDDKVLERIEKNLKPGGIILLHDIYPRHKTLLPRIIERLGELSYEIVPLTDLLNINAYE